MPASFIASTDLLPMVNPTDYTGTLVFQAHYEVIGDDQVRRMQILRADDRISVQPSTNNHLERLPYAPRVVVVRDEIDGREFYYRQAGWYTLFGLFGDRVVCAFDRLDVTDLTDDPALS